MSYFSNNFSIGTKIIFEKKPYIIESSDFVKPGKGQAFNRVKMRCLINNCLIEKILKSTDSLEQANIKEIKLHYLYYDKSFYYFMHQTNFSQYLVDKKIIGDNYKWLVENDIWNVLLWNNKPIQIFPPKFVTLKIINTNSNIKGETSNKSNKIATLITGAKVKVPSFLKVGEIIKINTKKSEYISRVK